MGRDYTYQAFISYAHADEAAARRIHNALETYSLPKDMNAAMRQKLTPIFRDVTELTASHSLSEKIQEAVKSSRYLIVLCSPAAKLSHWVNEEIKLFRRLHGESAILSVIVEGDPDTAFPPALIEDGREPLAANMTTREGFRFGITQLAASMLGVGLDSLVQRDSKRRRKRMRFITAGALLFSVLMGGMAWTAVDARDEAEVSRSEAEKMVEFLVTDLKKELDQVGRLSILDDVGIRVTDYYDAIPFADMDDDRLTRQARARHILGQVAIDQSNFERAKLELQAAYAATKEVLRRAPENETAIFSHAQSEYYLGSYNAFLQEHEISMSHFEEYSRLGNLLYDSDPKNVDFLMEAAWGENNIGYANGKLKEPLKAITAFKSGIVYFSKAHELAPNRGDIITELANTYAGLSREYVKINDYNSAREYRERSITLLQSINSKLKTSPKIRYYLAMALAEYEILQGAPKNKVCNLEIWNGVFTTFEDLIHFDSDNLLWRQNYIIYGQQFLKRCKLKMQKEEAKEFISLLLNVASEYEQDSRLNTFVLDLEKL